MSNRFNIITGAHPTLGTLYAAVDPEVTYLQSRVAELRFASLITPFKSIAEAKAALIEAGANVPNGGAE